MLLCFSHPMINFDCKIFKNINKVQFHQKRQIKIDICKSISYITHHTPYCGAGLWTPQGVSCIHLSFLHVHNKQMPMEILSVVKRDHEKPHSSSNLFNHQPQCRTTVGHHASHTCIVFIIRHSATIILTECFNYVPLSKKNKIDFQYTKTEVLSHEDTNVKYIRNKYLSHEN